MIIYHNQRQAVWQHVESHYVGTTVKLCGSMWIAPNTGTTIKLCGSMWIAPKTGTTVKLCGSG